MRDLPPEIPDEIAFRIRRQYGDVMTYARHLDQPYGMVHSVLTTGSTKILTTIHALATALGVTMQRLADALLVHSLSARKKNIDAMLGGRSQNQWAREAGVSGACVSYIMNNLRLQQLWNVNMVGGMLGLYLDDFYKCYQEHRNGVAC